MYEMTIFIHSETHTQIKLTLVHTKHNHVKCELFGLHLLQFQWAGKEE